MNLFWLIKARHPNNSYKNYENSTDLVTYSKNTFSHYEDAYLTKKGPRIKVAESEKNQKMNITK